MGQIVINDSNYQNYIQPWVGYDGTDRAKGLIPRDYQSHPVGYLGPVASPFDSSLLIPESEWDERIREQDAAESSLFHLRNRGNAGSQIQSYDQNGQGYCWAYSTVAAVTLVRAKNHQPFAPLSAHAVGCKIKNFRDEGGWNSLSLQFVAEKGVPTWTFWPPKSMSRSYDTPETWANALQNRCTEWWDLSDRDDEVRQQLVDFNWWGHSVCAVKLVKRSPFTIKIWNSWTDSWGEMGMGDLEGRKAIPDGAMAPRVISAS
jgi:hypothetical protein